MVRDRRVCKQCDNSGLVRTRRTFVEWLAQTAVYRCVNCGKRQSVGGWLVLDRNQHAICPSCGTPKLTTRLTIDPIEGSYRSPRNFLRKIMGGTLYKCRFCRLQFYDLRPLRNPESGRPKRFRFSSREPSV